MSKRIDLTGQTFGRLTVIKLSHKGKNHRLFWLCTCACGTIKSVLAKHLLSGATVSCGCYRTERTKETTPKKLVGHTFGRLTVIERAGSDKHQKALWLCKCSCGNEVTVPSGSLTSGQTLSCGCYKTSGDAKARPLAGKKFGMLTALYSTGSDKRKQRLWVCQCECGNTTTTTSGRLTYGHTKSCGCLRNRKGSDSPKWNPALTDTQRLSRRARLLKEKTHPSYAKVRVTTYNRDLYTCQCCGQRGGPLVAHHIMPWASYPSLRYAPENCITLCEYCHDEFHSIYGKEDFDDEDLNEYLNA